MAAFGKDREVLKRVTSLREAGNVSRQRRPTSKGGGWMRFSNQFKPSATSTDTIRFIPGEYPFEQVKEEKDAAGRLVLSTEKVLLPYHCYTEHFDGRTESSTICSAGPFAAYKGKYDPCLGCTIFWETGGKNNGRMSRRDMKAFAILNYAVFHEIEQTDYTTGAVRINEKTGKPYTQWSQCTGRLCDACTAQKPSKKGHVQHYSLGYGHFSQLKDYANEIGKNCKSCGSKNSIEVSAYTCPKCKDVVINMSETRLTDDDIRKMTEEQVVCSNCNTTVFLEEVLHCQGCPVPDRAGIFDVDISLKKVLGPHGSNQNTLLFTGHGEICGVDPIYEAKPLDLPRIFTPDSIEVQSTKFKEPIPAVIPRQPVPVGTASRPYGAEDTDGTPSSGTGGIFNRTV